jgi:oxygen-independent coproporphyrinogen III oxidase
MSSLPALHPTAGDESPGRVLPVIPPSAREEVVLQHARPGPRYTSYPPVPAWTTPFGEADYRAALEDLAGQRDDSISVYVHLPFCAERCAYCGCNATVTHHGHVVDRYLDRVEAEVGRVTDIIGRGRRVEQMHWGGGTPNLLDPAQTVRLHRILAEAFRFHRTAERSIEIDPRLGDGAQMHLYRELGFNRVSLGVQDLDPAVQEAIGRIQPEERTRRVFEDARTAGFESINLDLVYGLPRQTPHTLERTLQTILDWGPDRVASFGYAHLPHLLANQKRVDARGMPDSRERLALFTQTVDQLEEGGYRWIGLDHFARPGDSMTRASSQRALSRNFMGYVTDPAPHLLAFGSSSIGEVAGRYVQNESHLGRYQRSVDAGELPVIRGHHLTREDLRRREAIHGLLCNLDLRESSLPDSWRAAPDPWEPLRSFQQDGMVEIEEGTARVTRLGRFVLRSICMTLDHTLPAGTGPRFSPTV